MIREIVEVISKERGKLKIKFERGPACGCCGLQGFCKNTGTVYIDDRPELEIKEKDKIEIGITESIQYLASLILFLIPAIIFILIIVLSRRMEPVKAFIWAIMGSGIYFILAKNIIRRKKKYFMVKILRKI